MKKKISKKNLLFIVGIVLVLSITLGSAIVSSLLKIEGNTTIKKSSWVIYFDSVRKSTDSVSSTNDAKITNTEKTKVEFSANLKEPGDFYEFTVYTVNDGSIDAMINSIEKTTLTEEQQKYLDYIITYDNGRELKKCDPLDANTRRRIKAIVKFKDGLDINDYPKEDVNLDLFFDINYVQKNDACPTEGFKDEKVLTIDPNGGTYQNRKDETRIYLEKNGEYTIDEPVRFNYNFKGWIVEVPEENGTYQLADRTIIMGDEDVKIKADWEEGNFVARIMNTYYESVQDAFDAVSEKSWDDNTVHLIRNTSENPTNTSTNRFKFDLEGNTLNGTITNPSTGNINLVNGKVKADEDHEEALLNYGTVTMGTQGGGVQVENSIGLIGNGVGLKNIKQSGSTGNFNFYDGYIEGNVALINGYTEKEENYYIFSEHVVNTNNQRIYLIQNPNRAVAKTETEGTIYYYNLQDAINSVETNKQLNQEYTDNDYRISITREFEAAYELNISESNRIFIDLAGHDIATGEKIINNGYLNIYNTDETSAKIKPSKEIENNNQLVLDTVYIVSTTDNNIVSNKGTLSLTKTSIQAKNGYAVDNHEDGIINLDQSSIIKSTNNYGLHNDSTNLNIANGNIYGIYNEETMSTSDNVNVTNGTSTYAVYNEGTFNVNGGTISNEKNDLLIENKGTINVNDGTISAQQTAIKDGKIIVNGGEISSKNGPTLNSLDITINDGTISSENGKTVNSDTYVEYKNGRYNEYIGQVTMNGGTINSPDYGVYTTRFTMTGGTINSENIGVEDYNYEYRVSNNDTRVIKSSSNISGGTINSTNESLITNNLTMSDGTITSDTKTAVTISENGTITGGTITGANYGVDSKGKLNIGNDDGEISQTNPTITGEFFGVYIEGDETNFYDGTLKGQTAGYNGLVTGTPTGANVSTTTEEINGETYQVKYISECKNWLQVGQQEFASIDEASKAIDTTGTITVIDDIDITFIQRFQDENKNKNITFDLNGHTITTTQSIINESNVTIIDSSNEKTGTITSSRTTGIINELNKTLTIENGNYINNSNLQAFENRGTLTINNANIESNSIGITNYNNLIINNINIDNTNIGIFNDTNSFNNTTVYGNTTINNGTINTTDTAIKLTNKYSVGKVKVYNGNISGTNSAINGQYGTIEIYGGNLTSIDDKTLYTKYSPITVDNGTITSTNSTAIVTPSNLTINNGTITGKIAIANEEVIYSDRITTINNGHIIGTENAAIEITGTSSTNKVVVKGGTIEGATNGINTTQTLVIGQDNNTINTDSPVIIGHGQYAINVEYYTAFYDGILKGRQTGYHGLISIIPDGSLIKNDYEYINKNEYQTNYLITKGNWLRVGNEEFNSLNAACNSIEEEGTILVIADAYVDFKQTIPENKNITFDLDGHSLITTQPIQNNGTLTLVNPKENGGINNLRDYVFKNNGTLTIEQGNLHSEKEGIINNTSNGTLTINSGRFINELGNTIYNDGTITINNGYFQSKEKEVIYNNSNSVTINNGELTANEKMCINDYSGIITINGGKIKSDTSYGIQAVGYNNKQTTINVTSGEVQGASHGIISTNTNNTVNISGGNIKGLGGSGIYSNGTNNITAGRIEGETYGVYSYGANTTTTIGNDDGTIDIDSPVLKGELYGLNSYEGTLNFYDGIIKGITGRHLGNISNIAEHAQIFEDEDIDDRKIYYSEYLIKESQLAINVQTNKTYGNLQTAINEAKTNQTIKLLENVPLFYDLTVNNNSNLTLDLNGKMISANKQIINNVPFTITNSSEDESIIKTAAAQEIITNNSTLTIENITIKNNNSSNYVINNTQNITLNNILVNGISGVQNTNVMTINNSNIVVSKTAINNTGKLTINSGRYLGENYSIYSNSSRDVDITNVTLEGIYYNSGNNETNVNYGTIKSAIQNQAEQLNINNSTVNGKINNTGKLLLDSTNYRINVSSETAIINSNEMTIIGSNILVNKDATGRSCTAISNSGTLNINNESLIDVGIESTTNDYKGIVSTGEGQTVIDNAQVQVVGGNTSYGVYLDGEDSKVTILSGTISTSNAITAYGVYANKGTFEMGHYEGTGNETANVSITDPVVYSYGTTRGIGVKKTNGSFNFYDGIIRASKYAKPETTTNVEYQFEVTTYVDDETGFEYAVLEWMRNDYQGDTVCLLNGVYYKTVQEAIDKAEENDQITLLKSVTENINVAIGKNINLNLNKHSITTTLTNSGTLNVYNGSLQSFDKTTVLNYGTFIMGEDDGNVSSSSIRVISEATTIDNRGTLIIYDGYIEGVKAIAGNVDQVAQYARLRKEQDQQSEKRYIQSLSREAIEHGLTDLIITINPMSGYYNNSKEVQEVYIKYHETYPLSTPIKRGCDFIGWDISDENVYNPETNLITMDVSDITVKAKWEVNDTAVAKIGEEYYLSLQEAINVATDGTTIELVKDTIEPSITNRKDITIDLGTHKLTGKITNVGDLKLLNGVVENTNGPAIENNKSLTLGENDGEILEENIQIIGTDIGLLQNGRFNFYDGFIEGDVALSGKVDNVPKGYFLYNDHDILNNCQKIYLIGNPENAVAETRVGGTQYFFSLQDAIDTSAISGYEIFIRRDFEATYALNIKENTNITINVEGHIVGIGNDFTNDGDLKLYDSSEENRGIVSLAKTIKNNNNLLIENLDINEQNSANHTVTNIGNLHIKNSNLSSKDGNAVHTSGTMSIEGDSTLTANKYAIYNNQEEPLVLSAGTIEGIDNPKELHLQETVNIIQDNNEDYAINMNYQEAKLVMDNGTVTSVKNAINSYIDHRALGTEITINDGTIKSSNGYAVYVQSYENNFDNANKLTINGGHFEGYQSAVYSYYYNYMTINGGYYKNTARPGTDGAVRCYYSYTCDIKNSTIESYGEGIYISNSFYQKDVQVEDITIDNVTINVDGYTSGYGMNIYVYNSYEATKNNVIISNSNINVAKNSSYGIYLYNSNPNKVDMINNNVKAGYYGMYVYSNTNINIDGGRYEGGQYGIYATNSGTIINIGNPNKEYQKDSPYITGGLYGVYWSSGPIINFYNGELRGTTAGYNGTLGDIRKRKEVKEETESTPMSEKNYTVSTTQYSSNPVANYAKYGQGYATITYIGETNDVCENNKKYNYQYRGYEETFTAPCSGRYKLEVWGAQGGYSSYCGYGGYSKGEIELNENEILYINVGGQGQAKQQLKATALGGYNGGGAAIANSETRSMLIAGGGGATHIATKSGLLNTLENDKDKILIVAGGGGGMGYYSSNSRSGSGGGYKGGNGTYNYGTGGTQTSGGYNHSSYLSSGKGSFGQGGTTETDFNEENYYGGGGGGGFYGGGSCYMTSDSYNVCYSGGGSGYTGNDRLENTAMYGYNLPAYNPDYVVNYLDDKETFLQVGEETFSSIVDAIDYIDETGTIIVTKDAELTEQAEIPVGKNITLDVNGKNLVTSQTLTNSGTFTITDSDSEKKGNIYNQVSQVLKNTGTLTVDSVKIESSANTVITSTGTTQTINIINNATLIGNQIVNFTGTGTLNLESGTLQSKATAVYFNASNSTAYFGSGLIKSTNSGSYYGVHVNQNVNPSRNTITFGDITVESNSYAYYETGYYDETIMNGTTLKSTNGYALSFSGYNQKATLTDVTVESKGNAGLYTYYSNNVINLYNCNITNTYTSGYGIYNYESKIYIHSGNITGGKYGIYSERDSSQIDIGDSDAELSTTNPKIVGGEYGVYITKGKVNYYNGLLRGKVYGYYGAFDNVRKNKDILEQRDSTDLDLLTYTTTHSSRQAISDYAKVSNGYALITYIDESGENCEKGQKWYYDYTGSEETFNAPCAGAYKVEVWGAQGGGEDYVDTSTNASARGAGGYGGYATGNIELTANETLYINVGGMGSTTSKDANQTAIGGYNGGGNGFNCTSSGYFAGSGGGATHIATATGLLASLENNKESIIIVAGGGGGYFHQSYNSPTNHFPGNGGGFKGGNGKYSSNIAEGGTQESGYAFGQAQNQTTSYRPGAGGGYYSGQSAQYIAGGGSGYIGNNRLTDAYMVGYSVEDNSWINNYLNEKEGFLEVDNVLYKSFDDAVDAVNGIGTIKVMANSRYDEAVSIPRGKNITLDLNGKTLTMSKTITNETNFVVTDSSQSKTGVINNVSNNAIENKSNLTIDAVKIISTKYGLYNSAKEATIEIKNGADITGSYAIYQYQYQDQTLTITNSKISGTDTGIYSNNVSYNTTTITNSDIYGNNYAIYNSYNPKQSLTITGGTISSGTGYGIYDTYQKTTANRSQIKVTNVNVDTSNPGLYVAYDDVEIKGSTFNKYGGAKNDYAIYCGNSAACSISDNTKITSLNSSGIYLYDNETEIDNADITAAYYGIYIYKNNITLNNVNITGTTENSYGIFADEYETDIVFNDSTINSKNIGVYLGHKNNKRKTIQVNTGTIIGELYGIYQDYEDTLVRIGNPQDAVSITNPHIEGGAYSIYKTDGELHFYSGRLKGYVRGNPGNIDIIRDEYEIAEVNDELQLYLKNRKNTNTDSVSETPIENTAKIGNGYARVTYINNEILYNEEETYQDIDCSSLIGQTIDYSATKTPQTFVAKCPGTYKLEVWGAQGGAYYTNYGGKGGYGSGYIDLSESDNLYVYVGTAGNNGGYNGGGKGPYIGGGATDIRVKKSIYSRILVAGGGGASGTSASGGAGGGAQGERGNYSNCCSYGNPGTNRAGGSYYGKFGEGGTYVGGGGGGGWYGGGAGGHVSNGGAGGSGYAYTDKSFTPSGYDVPKRFRLYDTSLITGNTSLPSYRNDKTVIGNTGDGHARITYIAEPSKTDKITVNLKTPIGTIENPTLTYTKGTTFGNVPSPTVEDENIHFDGWYADKDYKNKVNSDFVIKKNIVIYAKFTYSSEYCQSMIDNPQNFDYTGTAQEFNVWCPGTYKLEVWGAQGGSSTYETMTNTGGYGGYTVGTVNLNYNEKLYIYVGGKGQSVEYINSRTTFDTSKGYNGGGSAGYSSNTDKRAAVAGGGGATHIATSPGLLASLYNDQSSVLIVAGAGGGSITYQDSPYFSGDGGHGGGNIGGNGRPSNPKCYNYGAGGTQNSGGSYIVCEEEGSTSRSTPIGPTFGTGSNWSDNNGSSRYAAGGGAGWYGGNSGYYGPGGGGSGYSRNSRLNNTNMYAYGSTNDYQSEYSNVAYLVELKQTILNKTQNKEYKNLQTAISEAHNQDIIQLKEDTNVSYEVEIYDDVNITLDLNGHTLAGYSAINNYGTVRIINGDDENQALLRNNSVLPLINNYGVLNIEDITINVNIGISNEETGTLTISGVDITSSNKAIINQGTMRVYDSTIQGENYAVYSNTTKTNTIENSTLRSNQNAYYKYLTGQTTITNTNIYGQVTNVKANSNLNIVGGTITGAINNSGNTTISGVTITYVGSQNIAEKVINNSGILTLSNDTINHKHTSQINNENVISTIYNTGTLTSSTTSYKVQYENALGMYKVIHNIENKGILNSEDDTYEAYGALSSSAIYNSSSNTSNVKRATINIHDSINARGIYNEDGTINLINGTINTTSSTNGYGIYVNGGTPVINGTTINVSSNEEISNGAFIKNGTLTIEHGNIYTTGDTVYGVYIDKGTLVLGIEDGRGTDAADVSITDPHIEAIGTTQGIGVRMGDGSFNYFDGYITASTSPRGAGDITTKTDKNYQVVTKHDDETGYDYCILEFIK